MGFLGSRDVNRFVVIKKESDFMEIVVIVDKQTGVNYLFCEYGGGGGLTPLLDSNGKPIVTRIY